MKKFTLIFVLMLVVASIVSCTKTEYITITPEEEAPDTSTYTIMMYGCGGKNLDAAMVLNIQEALLEGASERVNFTGMIKFSQRYQKEEVLKGAQRFIVGEAGETWYEPVEVLSEKLKLYDPQNLTDFINWSKEQCPADEYILLLWNHGSAWLPSKDYPNDSRAVIHDDNNLDKGLSLNGLVKGIKDSNTKFKMIYYDACLMGMIEIMAGLGDCTEYTMSASHITPGIGGDYNSLIHHLNTSTNFEQAMKDYCYETVSHWNTIQMPLDLMVVNNSKMEPLLNEIKVLSGYLKEVAEIYASYDETADNSIEKSNLCSAYEEAIKSCYHYDWQYYPDGYAGFPFYDLHDFVENLANANGGVNNYSAKFVDISSRINRAFNNTIVCKQLTSSIKNEKHDLTMGVTIVDKDIWVELDGEHYADTDYNYQMAYDELVFQQKTGWGNWLSVNPVTPTGNPNPLTYANVPEDDGEESQKPTTQEEIEYILELIGKSNK